VETLANVTDDAESAKYSPKISEIILAFSRADETVKKLFCTKEVLEILLPILKKIDSKTLLDILKATNFLSQDSRTLNMFQMAGAIQVFVKLMDERDKADSKAPKGRITDTHMQYLLQTLFNLCRLVPARQEEAASVGIIPHLKHFIDSDSTCKQFALPILCEFARAKGARQFLWENNCVEFYIKIFKQGYPWQVQAVDALAAWLIAEPDRVAPALATESHCKSLQALFLSLQGDAFVTVVEPLLKVVVHPNVAQMMEKVGFIKCLLERLNHPNALVRVNLLKILSAIIDSSSKPKEIVKEYALNKLVETWENDRAVLVAEMGGQLRQKLVAKNAMEATVKKS